MAPRLTPDARILDVGSGRDPTFQREQLPPGAHYVGLDVSAAELRLAPSGCYDDTVIGDVARHIPELENTFDLAVSWQVLEHVKPIDAALENMRSYLRPGGLLVAMFSGGFSTFGMLNRLLPNPVSQRLAAWALKIDPADVFPAHYDRCYHSALLPLLSGWSSVDLHPMYRGAVYARNFRPVLHTYLAYENWAAKRHRSDLATHYLLVARR